MKRPGVIVSDVAEEYAKIHNLHDTVLKDWNVAVDEAYGEFNNLGLSLIKSRAVRSNDVGGQVTAANEVRISRESLIGHLSNNVMIHAY